MLEIQPVLPSFPAVKVNKIKRDDHPPEKRQNEKKHQAEKQDAEPVQHIDEIV
jgi:hypothetical protein